MPRHRAVYRIARPPEAVFDVIGTNVYVNHPQWEPEVLEIRPLTEGPVRVGSRAVMVRQEFGRRSETPYEVTALEPGRLIAFSHDAASMAFALRFGLAPVGAGETELTVEVEMRPRGPLRIASPLIALQLPGRTDRTTRRMIALVEARPLPTGAPPRAASAAPGGQAAPVTGQTA